MLAWQELMPFWPNSPWEVWPVLNHSAWTSSRVSLTSSSWFPVKEVRYTSWNTLVWLPKDNLSILRNQDSSPPKKIGTLVQTSVDLISWWPTKMIAPATWMNQSSLLTSTPPVLVKIHATLISLHQNTLTIPTRLRLTVMKIKLWSISKPLASWQIKRSERTDWLESGSLPSSWLSQ